MHTRSSESLPTKYRVAATLLGVVTVGAVGFATLDSYFSNRVAVSQGVTCEGKREISVPYGAEIDEVAKDHSQTIGVPESKAAYVAEFIMRKNTLDSFIFEKSGVSIAATNKLIAPEKCSF